WRTLSRIRCEQPGLICDVDRVLTKSSHTSAHDERSAEEQQERDGNENEWNASPWSLAHDRRTQRRYDDRVIPTLFAPARHGRGGNGRLDMPSDSRCSDDASARRASPVARASCVSSRHTVAR